MNFALIPIKALAWGKSRLSPLLSEAARHALSRAMLTDVLTSVLHAPAVDGAVVLTDTLRIIGFGAEVTESFSGGDKVHVAHTAEATETKEERFSEYGTRHRSAFRFIASMEPSVGFIMSQDGGVKAVMQVGSKLVMWPYFQIGFTTALS